MQSKYSTICRYINLQELYFINISTDQFTSYSYTNNNTAVSTAKCSYLALHQYIVTILITTVFIKICLSELYENSTNGLDTDMSQTDRQTAGCVLHVTL